MAELDAVVLADHAPFPGRVAGLSLAERARRVAARVGAARIAVVATAADRAALRAFWDAPTRAARLLVVRAGDQLVHTPLVAPMVAVPGDAIAVAPADADVHDLAAGAPAGAVILGGAAAAQAIDALIAGASVDELASAAPDAARVPHGNVARHAVVDRGSARAAETHLFRILVKPQDNAITRYLYRPVSLPLTRLLVRTPVTPNQVSLFVGAMVLVGLWLSWRASFDAVIAGTVTILAASYLDCCDGEIARVKLLTSKAGAWLDTIIDELSTLGYLVAIGVHCRLQFGAAWPIDTGGDPWPYVIGAAALANVGILYFIYWNLIALVGSANSQDYVGRFRVVDGDAPGTARLVPAAATAALYSAKPLPQPLRLIAQLLPHVIRRDFISWLAVILAVAHATPVSFALLTLGTAITLAVVIDDHRRVRAQLRQIARSGRRLVR